MEIGKPTRHFCREFDDASFRKTISSIVYETDSLLKNYRKAHSLCATRYLETQILKIFRIQTLSLSFSDLTELVIDENASMS